MLICLYAYIYIYIRSAVKCSDDAMQASEPPAHIDCKLTPPGGVACIARLGITDVLVSRVATRLKRADANAPMLPCWWVVALPYCVAAWDWVVWLGRLVFVSIRGACGCLKGVGCRATEEARPC